MPILSLLSSMAIFDYTIAPIGKLDDGVRHATLDPFIYRFAT